MRHNTGEQSQIFHIKQTEKSTQNILKLKLVLLTLVRQLNFQVIFIQNTIYATEHRRLLRVNLRSQLNSL